MGYRVRAITEHGSAKQAGILEGDLIVRVDGRKVPKRVDLTRALKWKRPGNLVNVRVKRNGSYHNLTVKLGGTNGKPSMGVISKPDRARAYKAKVAAKKAEITARNGSVKPAAVRERVFVSSPADLADELSVHAKAEGDSKLMRKAKDEASLAMKYLEDMQNLDEYRLAKDMREALRRENLNGIRDAAGLVDKFLRAKQAQRDAEVAVAIGDIEVNEDGDLVHVRRGFGRRLLSFTAKASLLSAKAAAVLAVLGGLGYGASFAYQAWPWF